MNNWKPYPQNIPEKGLYLVTISADWSGTTFRYVELLTFTGKIWRDAEGWPEDCVTAWMESPEPYQEKGA